jgi:integrase
MIYTLSLLTVYAICTLLSYLKLARIKKVQERLGHSDIKMTMNIYTHVTRTVKEETATRFEKFIEK